MTSKAYFTLATVFVALYLGTALGTAAGLPEWVHDACTLGLAVAIALGLWQRRREQQKPRP
jgi:hypothetical protein